MGEAALRFRNEDDEGLVKRVGVDFAAEKSEASDGSLGWKTVDEGPVLLVVEKPWN